jgi:uncharacterized membrane protein
MKPALDFLRASTLQGLRPGWALTTSVLAVIGGTVITIAASNPLWVVVAVLAILLLGATRVNADAKQRLAIAEPKAAQADLLQKRNSELARMYTVSQEQYKVLEGFRAEHGR